MNLELAPIILPAMAIGCAVASYRFEGGSRYFLLACAALNFIVLAMILARH
jgi:hypothetical protein